MKRSELLRHLRRYGCTLKREGASHSLWQNPSTGQVEAIPRHLEVPNLIGRTFPLGRTVKGTRTSNWGERLGTSSLQ